MQRRTVPSNGPVGVQGWWLNTRRDQFKDPRVRQALGYAFDFQWVDKNIMFGLYERTVSYFQNTSMMAEGRPGPDELALLEPFRGKVPDSVFGEAVLPPVSDGSGQDRGLLGQAYKLLQAAGCKRDGNVLKLASGEPLRVEFLDFQGSLERHTQPFIKNLQLLGIDARFRVVDAAQYQSRLNDFDFDVITLNRGGDSTPGEGLRISYGSEAARQPGSQNFTGTADPMVDALIDKALHATTRAELTTVCRALDRVLRASYYWVPMWNKPNHWLAYWDQFGWPAQRAAARPRRAVHLVVRRGQGPADQGQGLRWRPISSAASCSWCRPCSASCSCPSSSCNSRRGAPSNGSWRSCRACPTDPPSGAGAPTSAPGAAPRPASAARARNTAAPRGSTRSSSRNSRCSSASTSRPTSASC